MFVSTFTCHFDSSYCHNSTAATNPAAPIAINGACTYCAALPSVVAVPEAAVPVNVPLGPVTEESRLDSELDIELSSEETELAPELNSEDKLDKTEDKVESVAVVVLSWTSVRTREM